MSEEKRTIKGWAARLSTADESLTLEEARTLATIAAADRLVEIQARVEDVSERLRRLEEQATPGVKLAFGWLSEVVGVLLRMHFWAAKSAPGYPVSRDALAALMAAPAKEDHHAHAR